MQPNAFDDWAKLEGSRSKLQDWQLSLLKSWDCHRDPFAIMNVIKSIVPEFKRVYQSLCEKFGIEEYPEVDKVLNMVL